MAETGSRTVKILVVDDDPVVQRVLGARFRKHDWTTLFAGDAISAIAVARAELPDLIVLDVALPAGDAFVVVERLSSIPALSHIPVVVISATDTPENRSRAREAGAVAFFEKSDDTTALEAAVIDTLAA